MSRTKRLRVDQHADLFQSTRLKCGLEACLLLRIEILDFSRYMVRNDELMGVASNQVHAIMAEEG